MPVQPGIGTGEGALGELHPLLLGVESQQDAQALADIALDDAGEREFPPTAAQQQRNFASVGEAHGLRKLNADTIIGIVAEHTRTAPASRKLEGCWQIGGDAMGLAHLLYFGRHGERPTDDQQVVKHPE